MLENTVYLSLSLPPSPSLSLSLLLSLTCIYTPTYTHKCELPETLSKHLLSGVHTHGCTHAHTHTDRHIRFLHNRWASVGVGCVWLGWFSLSPVWPLPTGLMLFCPPETDKLILIFRPETTKRRSRIIWLWSGPSFMNVFSLTSSLSPDSIWSLFVFCPQSWLRMYGYLPQASRQMSTMRSAQILSAAVSDMQRFYSLQVTGKMDPETIRLD